MRAPKQPIGLPTYVETRPHQIIGVPLLRVPERQTYRWFGYRRGYTYAIENLVNGRFYVGQTSRLQPWREYQGGGVRLADVYAYFGRQAFRKWLIEFGTTHEYEFIKRFQELGYELYNVDGVPPERRPLFEGWPYEDWKHICRNCGGLVEDNTPYNTNGNLLYAVCAACLPLVSSVGYPLAIGHRHFAATPVPTSAVLSDARQLTLQDEIQAQEEVN